MDGVTVWLPTMSYCHLLFPSRLITNTHLTTHFCRRFVELGTLLSSPGLAPVSLLPQLTTATERALAAAAGGGGSSSSCVGGGAGASFRLGDSVVVGSQQRTRGVIR